MQRFAKTLALAAALLVAGGAQAERATATIVADADIGIFPTAYEIRNLQGGNSMAFSELLLGALTVANITTQAVAPGNLIEFDSTLTLTAPIHTLSGVFDSDTAEFEVMSTRTLGGVQLTAWDTRPNGEPSNASTGGSLSITDIKVEPSTQSIYAKLTGANGMGTLHSVRVWNYGSITGDDLTVQLADGTFLLRNTLSALTITDAAFNLFTQSLGLTPLGQASLASVTDYGVVNTAIAFEFRGPPSIPEPSTYMLMGLGLVGLAFASRRARRLIPDFPCVALRNIGQ